MKFTFPSGYFAQHHLDTLNVNMNPVQFLASRFPGRTEQEYRSHLGNFQITGMTGWVSITYYVLYHSLKFLIVFNKSALCPEARNPASRSPFSLFNIPTSSCWTK